MKEKQRLRPNTQIDTMTSLRLKGVTNLKQRLFLSAYARLGNVSAAAHEAKVSRRSHYSWLNEPEYAAAFAGVQEEVKDMLFEEAGRLAVDGVEQPISCRGMGFYETKRDPETGAVRPTNNPVTIRRCSDTLLMFLLNALRPEKYRSKVGRAAGPPFPELAPFSDEEVKLLEQLSRKGKGLPPIQR